MEASEVVAKFSSPLENFFPSLGDSVLSLSEISKMSSFPPNTKREMIESLRVHLDSSSFRPPQLSADNDSNTRLRYYVSAMPTVLSLN